MPRTDMVVEKLKDLVRIQEKENGLFEGRQSAVDEIVRTATNTRGRDMRGEVEQSIDEAYETAAIAIRYIQQYG